jgi:cellulose synthase/poly-beta-1,6-N-acetylglucosamine synthase-like glycosyltransferase
MRGGRALVALTVILLAVLGAVLHPLAFVLSILPVDTRQLVAWLNDARVVIFNLLAWGIVALLVVMVVFTFRGRLVRKVRTRTIVSGERAAAPAESPRIVVAVTAYNDAQATANTVRDFIEHPGVVEVLVIDNNSTDRTAELAGKAGARVIHEPRQGYGYACIRGLSEASRVTRADIVALVEGDGTFVADDLKKFLAYIGQADMVVGNRVVRGLVEPGSQMDYFFTWGNMAVAFLLRLRFWDSQFLGVATISDVGCTYRVIRRQALEQILPDLTVGGYHFSPHMMLVALLHQLTLLEIPITFRRRIGRSKGASQSIWKGLAVGSAMIWHILTFSPKPAPAQGRAALPEEVAVRPR